MVSTPSLSPGDRDDHFGKRGDEVLDVDVVKLVMAVDVSGVPYGDTVYTPVYTCQRVFTLRSTERGKDILV